MGNLASFVGFRKKLPRLFVLDNGKIQQDKSKRQLTGGGSADCNEDRKNKQTID